MRLRPVTAHTVPAGTSSHSIEFLNAGKTWDIKGADGMKIGIFTNLIWNPALDDVNFVGGFSFRM